MFRSSRITLRKVYSRVLTHRKNVGWSFSISSHPSSLPRRRLPKLNLIAFRINDPGKFSLFRIVHFIKYVAAFFAQHVYQRV